MRVLNTLLQRKVLEFYDDPFFNRSVGNLNWVVWKSHTSNDVLMYYTLNDGEIHFVL